MALRKIVEQGDECLTKVCRPVTKFDRRLHDLLDDMAETLADANGAGLAAPQVGILRRVCLVLDEEAEEYLELINPEIIAQSGEQTGLEGCLSVPGKWGIVTRPNRVRVRAQDRDGDWFEAEAEGLTGAELLWLAAADSDPRRDVTVVGEVVVVDARSKRPGVEGHPARFPNVAVASSATVERVDARWAEYGLGETMASPSERYRRLLLSDKAAW